MNNNIKKFSAIALSITTIVWLMGGVVSIQTAKAATIEELLAQIQLLQAQLLTLQGSSSAPACTFTSTLKLGSKGDTVKCLQQYLNGASYTVSTSGVGSAGNESTYFGSKTAAAVKSWQAANGLPSTGLFGSMSRAKYTSLAGTTPTTPTTPTPTGGGLAVSLASDTPSTKTIGTGTAYNPALKVNLTAGSSNVKVTALTLKKSGFMANTNLNGVDVIDSTGVRHGNVVTSINADDTVYITMANEPINVLAGKTEAITIRFNLVRADFTGTIAFGIESASVVVSDAASVSGTFPISGNAMNIVSGLASLASTTLDVLATTGSTTLNVDAASSQEITRFRIQETSSNEDTKLYSLTLYNYGNAAATDYKDVTLEAVDGTVLATAQAAGQNVVFNLSAPYAIAKGVTKDFIIKTKIVSGTTRTINLVVYNNYDIDLRGTTTGVSLIPGAGSGDSTFPIGNGWNIQTVGAGSMTLARASDSPSSATTPGSNDAVLAKFTAKPTGENMELRQISFAIATSTTGADLTGNVVVRVNGSTVYSVGQSSISNVTGSPTTITLSTYPILTAGQNSTIEIVGSVPSTATAAATYQVTAFDILQVKRLTSNDLVDPSLGTVTGLSIAVNAGALIITTLATPVANSIVAGASGYEFATITLNAQTSGEDIRVSKLRITYNGTSTVNSNVGNFYLYKDSETSPLTTTASTASFGTPGSTATMDFNFSSAIVIPRTVVTLHLKADVLTGANDTATSSFSVASSSAAVTATGATTGNALTHGSDITYSGNGQTMTVTSAGTLTLSLVSGSGASPSTNQVVNGGTIGGTYFAVKLTSQYETQKITTLRITATSTGGNNLATTTLSNISLYEGTTLRATKAQADSCNADGCIATFTATDNILSAPVPTTGVTLYVKADVNAGGSSVLGNNFKFMIASSTGDVAVKGANTGSTSGTRTGTPTANGITYVVPQNVKIEAVSPTTATNVGTSAGQNLAVFKVTNNGSATIYLSSSTMSFTNSGSATTGTNFKIFSSAMGGGQSDVSSWNSGNGYLAAAGTTGASSTISFATTTLTVAERKIDGGSWRYLTIRTSAASANNDTYQFSVSALGNILFNVDEVDLGYSGNDDADLSDTIYGLYVGDIPALSTVTAKT